MNKSLEFPFGFYANDNTPLDGKYFNRTTQQPYTTISEATTLLPTGVRYKGLTINIAGVEYWWNPSENDLSLNPTLKLVSDNNKVSKSGDTMSGKLTVTNSFEQGLGHQDNGEYSHIEGYSNIVTGEANHVEGVNNTISGDYSHVEGENNTSIQSASHIEGKNNISNGEFSHIEGENNISEGIFQHVQGKFNNPISTPNAFIIGNGIDDENRSNLVEAFEDKFRVKGDLIADKVIKFGTNEDDILLGNGAHIKIEDLPISINTQSALDNKENIGVAQTLITNLKDGVAPAGDTLQKLYNLVLGAVTQINVGNIAGRNALNITKLPTNVFVTDDGDGRWALYQATTTGVNATYVKLSDPDLLNAVMSASQIKTAYESNADTNAFTNALLSKLNAVDQNVSSTEKATWNGKQNTLVSGTNIKTVGGQSVLGGGDIPFPVSGIITTTLQVASIPTETRAGFVTYLNTLATPLVVATNEIFKLECTTSGKVFELLLRGRSFGTGQPAITTADVRDATAFLEATNIKLSAYPSTRNDGASPTNRILGTDVNGFVKMYSIPLMPIPFIGDLIPDSYLPSTTGNIRVKGAFFTEAMCNRTLNPTWIVAPFLSVINYVTFIDDNEILINGTTVATEGSYSLTLNNGSGARTKANAMLLVGGVVFTPTTSADWTNIVQPVNFSNGKMELASLGILGSGRLIKLIEPAKKTRLLFTLGYSPLNANQGIQTPASNILEVRNSSTNAILWVVDNFQYQNLAIKDGAGNDPSPNARYGISGNIWNTEMIMEYISGIWYFKGGSNNIATAISQIISVNHYVVFNVTRHNIINIKHIELP